MIEGTVQLAYLHATEVTSSFHQSMSQLIAYDVGHGQRVIRGGAPAAFRCGSGGLVEGRNKVVRYFLEESNAEWLWMIDTDMGFAPDTVDRLLEAADPDERPVIGALCFGVKEAEPDGMGGFHIRPFPTLYEWAKDPNDVFGFHIRREYQPNTLTRVAGTGAACLLVHRSVLDKIGSDWFDQLKQSDGKPVSEDLSFCFRVNTAGFPVYVHTGVPTTHNKPIWLGEDLYLVFEAMNRAYQRQAQEVDDD